jgi:hypothetical protein
MSRYAPALIIKLTEFLNPGPDLDIKIDKQLLPEALIAGQLILNLKRQGGL